jgi:hypothetical protein
MGDLEMRSFIVACLAAVVIAAAGAVTLSFFQQSADVAFSTPGVRL